MALVGRTYSNEKYRYAFNGKEKDGDIGEDDYDYGFRIHDARLGRFLSVDPLTKKYAFYTPYQFAGNNPTGSIDIDGLEPDVTWNANEQKAPVPNQTGEMKKRIEAMVSETQSCRTCQQDEKDRMLFIKKSYEEGLQNIADGRKKGYTTSSDNLQFYMNGAGGTKIESLNYLKSYAPFNVANQRLNNYLYKMALDKAFGMNAGQTIEFSVKGYTASLTGTYGTDLYTSSGTSFIAGTAAIKIVKNNDKSFRVDIQIYKTWLDTYDWHDGAGVRGVTDVGDAGYNTLRDIGAQNFEMRAYFITNWGFALKFPDGYPQVQLDNPIENISVKTLNHPDRQMAGKTLKGR